MIKKELSYADKARLISQKYKKRLGDDFSKKDKYAEEAMNRELEALKQKQETVRAEIYGKMNPEGLPMGQRGLTLPDPKKPTLNRIDTPELMDMPESINRFSAEQGPMSTLADAPSDRPYKTPVSPLGLLPSLIGYGLNRRAINELKGLKYKPSMISPERISLAPERSMIESRRRERGNIIKGIGYSSSPSQRFSRSLAGITESDRLAGEELSRSYLTEDTTNAGYSQRAKEINAQEGSRARQYNLGLRGQIAQAKLASNQGLVSGLSGYMSDLVKARQYDNILAVSSDDYAPVTEGSYFKQPAYRRTLDYILGNRPLSFKTKQMQNI